MQDRVDGFIRKIKEHHHQAFEKGEDAKDIVVVSHGQLWKTFRGEIGGLMILVL